MRGEQIFKKLVTENDDSLSRKGRNAELLALRNKCLEARYYYYAYHKKKSYEDILQILTNEFYLTKERVIRIIQHRAATIKELKAEKVTIYKLQSTWPQYKW